MVAIYSQNNVYTAFNPKYNMCYQVKNILPSIYGIWSDT